MESDSSSKLYFAVNRYRNPYRACVYFVHIFSRKGKKIRAVITIYTFSLYFYIFIFLTFVLYSTRVRELSSLYLCTDTTRVFVYLRVNIRVLSPPFSTVVRRSELGVVGQRHPHDPHL